MGKLYRSAGITQHKFVGIWPEIHKVMKAQAKKEGITMAKLVSIMVKNRVLQWDRLHKESGND